jgi:cytoskeletal protein RodZ
MSADESDFTTPTSSLPVTAGQRLAAARNAAGLSLAELSARTKISERHLGALESGDFAALPGRTYVFGFTRTFAKSVGLDPAELAAAMGRDYSRSAPEPDLSASVAFARAIRRACRRRALRGWPVLCCWWRRSLASSGGRTIRRPPTTCPR